MTLNPMFNFNIEAYDFWPIYDAIKRFYPIGIDRNNNQLYLSYPGLKILEDIIADNVHKRKHFTERWESFTTEIKNEIKKEIIGTTYGQAPSFSSYVLLNTVSIDDLTRTKEIHFFVSLVGPFYTIVGRDHVAIKTNDDKNYRSTCYLAVSPEKEFKDIFNLLCHKIEQRFKGYRFVPFGIGTETLNGLTVRYSDENLNTIFHALFNNNIDLTVSGRFGDIHFKYQDWARADHKDIENNWVVYPFKDRNNIDKKD